VDVKGNGTSVVVEQPQNTNNIADNLINRVENNIFTSFLVGLKLKKTIDFLQTLFIWISRYSYEPNCSPAKVLTKETPNPLKL